MKKIALSLVIFLLVFGGLATAAEEVEVPFSAVKSSCYGQIDMSKAEFLLSEIEKDCVKDSWLEENLTEEETQAKEPKEEDQEEVKAGASFDVSRNEIFDLLKNPQKIEPELSSGWQYAVSGWEHSDLNDGTARWLAQSGDYYNYELIGQPANKFTLMAGITGETENTTHFLTRAALVMRAIGVTPENMNSILTNLVKKAAENPNTKFEVESDDILIQMQLIKSISTLLLTLEPA